MASTTIYSYKYKIVYRILPQGLLSVSFFDVIIVIGFGVPSNCGISKFNNNLQLNCQLNHLAIVSFQKFHLYLIFIKVFFSVLYYHL